MHEETTQNISDLRRITQLHVLGIIIIIVIYMYMYSHVHHNCQHVHHNCIVHVHDVMVTCMYKGSDSIGMWTGINNKSNWLIIIRKKISHIMIHCSRYKKHRPNLIKHVQ